MWGQASKRVGYGELWRGNPDFRRLFFARTVSLFGDWFNLLALLALLRAIGEDSAMAYATLLVLKTLPVMVASPLAGVVVDRYSRKSIMIISDVVRALVVVLMLSLYWLPDPRLLYVLVAMQSMTSAFFEPARTALLPDLVSEEELSAANALGAALWSTMLALGAAAGGVVTSQVGWEVAIGVDALTYVVSALFLLRLNEPRAAEDSTAERLGGWASFVEGLVYLRGNPEVLTLAWVKTVWCVAAGGITIVLTTLGERVYADSVADGVLAVTVLFVARGVGTGVGPFVVREAARDNPRTMERLIGWSFALAGVAYACFPYAQSLAVAALGVSIAHLGGATLWVFSTVRLQHLVPAPIRGRVFAFEVASFTVVSAFVTMCFGWWLDRPDASPREVGSTLGMIFAVGWVYWTVRMWWFANDHQETTNESDVGVNR